MTSVQVVDLVIHVDHANKKVLLSFRSFMSVTMMMSQDKIDEIVAGRQIVIAAAQLATIKGQQTHGIPVMFGTDNVLDAEYAIAEICLGKLKISAVTDLPSKEVSEEERQRISGFPYYGSTVFTLHPDLEDKVAIAASGLKSDEDVEVVELLRDTTQHFFATVFADLLAQSINGYTFVLVA